MLSYNFNFSNPYFAKYIAWIRCNEQEIINSRNRKMHMHVKAYVCVAVYQILPFNQAALLFL